MLLRVVKAEKVSDAQIKLRSRSRRKVEGSPFLSDHPISPLRVTFSLHGVLWLLSITGNFLLIGCRLRFLLDLRRAPFRWTSANRAVSASLMSSCAARQSVIRPRAQCFYRWRTKPQSRDFYDTHWPLFLCLLESHLDELYGTLLSLVSCWCWVEKLQSSTIPTT